MRGSQPCFGADLSDYPDAPEWIRIMPLGHFVTGTNGEPWDITPDIIVEMARNFSGRVLGRDVGLDIDHSHAGGAPGWIKDAQPRSDGLWTRIEWTAAGRELVASKQYRYVSPEWQWDYVRPQDGAQFHNVLLGLSLTNQPYFNTLPPLVASSSPADAQLALAEPSRTGPLSLQARSDELDRLARQPAVLQASGGSYEKAVAAVLAQRPDLSPDATRGQLAPGELPRTSTLSLQARSSELDRLARQPAVLQACGGSYEKAVGAVLAQRPDLSADAMLAPGAPGTQAADMIGLEVDAIIRQHIKAHGGSYADACAAVLKANPEFIKRLVRAGGYVPTPAQRKRHAAGAKLATLARALADKEGITFDSAMQRIMTDNPDLKEAFLAPDDNTISVDVAV